MSCGTASPLQAPLMLVLATIFWALSFPTMKALGQMQQALIPDGSSWFMASLCMAYRFGLAGVIMLAFCGKNIRSVTRSELWEGIGLAIFASGGLILQMDGLAYTSASTSAFLTQCYCLVIPIWISILEKRWPSFVVIVSCLLVLAGVGILSKVNWREFKLGRGELETLMASVVFAAQILWLQRPCFAGNRVQNFTLVMFVMIALFCLPIAFLTARRYSDIWTAYSTGSTAIALVILVLFSTLGGYLLMNRWQPLVGATEAGLIYCIEPVFASGAAMFMPAWFSNLGGIDYPNECIEWNLVVGGGLIFIANVLVQLRNSSRDRV
ncbi:MAG: DMT family transporter [Verrucomicrobiae bacterium]|nr:DMT family transporter [Verrucomicrobiae bacterium]